MCQTNMSHDFFSKKFEIQYDEAQGIDKSSVSKFFNKSPFGTILVQFDRKLHILKSH